MSDDPKLVPPTPIYKKLLEWAATQIKWRGNADSLLFVKADDLSANAEKMLGDLVAIGNEFGDDVVSKDPLFGQYVAGDALKSKIIEVQRRRVEEVHKEKIEDCRQMAYSSGYDSIRGWVVDNVPASIVNNDVVFKNIHDMSQIQRDMLDALHCSDTNLITTDTLNPLYKGVRYIAVGNLRDSLIAKATLVEAEVIDLPKQQGNGGEVAKLLEGAKQSENVERKVLPFLRNPGG